MILKSHSHPISVAEESSSAEESEDEEDEQLRQVKLEEDQLELEIAQLVRAGLGGIMLVVRVPLPDWAVWMVRAVEIAQLVRAGPLRLGGDNVGTACVCICACIIICVHRVCLSVCLSVWVGANAYP